MRASPPGKLEDQMAKTPQAAALQFMDAIVPAATAKAASEANDIQNVIDAQKGRLSAPALGLELSMPSKSAKLVTIWTMRR
jgi:hypothetical protein